MAVPPPPTLKPPSMTRRRVKVGHLAVRRGRLPEPWVSHRAMTGRAGRPRQMSTVVTRPGSGLPRRASVVVVGGGVIGTSIAFHLAEVGARPGQEIDFRPVGYLFLLSRPEDVTAFERSIALQRQLGVPSRLIDPGEARRLSPLINTDGLLAAAFSPDDGLATPEAVVQGYATGARRHGAHIEIGCELLDVRLRGETIQAAVTSKGVVETPALVCAAGAWSRQVGAMVGMDLPVTPFRRQVLLTQPVPGLPEHLPMTIDFASSFYFHREGPGLLMGMSLDDEPPGFNLNRDDAWIPRLAEIIARRAPSLADVGVAGGWAGLYEVTRDHNALIGEAPRPTRLLYAAGFSGHGFLQSPAVGEVVRDLFLGRRPPVDVSPLAVDRFHQGTGRPELNVV